MWEEIAAIEAFAPCPPEYVDTIRLRLAWAADPLMVNQAIFWLDNYWHLVLPRAQAKVGIVAN